MKRMLLIGALVLPVLACTAPGERIALPPLPPGEVTPRSYGELVARARALADHIITVSFEERWEEARVAARELERTAEYLAKAMDVPARHKDTRATLSTDLGKLSRMLLEELKPALKDTKKIDVITAKIKGKVNEMS